MDPSERELVEAAREGNHSAFDTLCQMYRPELTRLCLRFLGRHEDAEDVAQELFSRAWQHLASYRGDASLRTWFWEIGRNLCLNRLRARKSLLNQNTVSIHAAVGESEALALDMPDPAPTPEQQAVDAAHLNHIRSEIARCSAEKKWLNTDWQLFALRIEKAIPYADFAQLHGRDEAYWRNRWRDKIRPVLERVRDRLENSAI